MVTSTRIFSYVRLVDGLTVAPHARISGVKTRRRPRLGLHASRLVQSPPVLVYE